ncbi:hypothetical protein BDV06DRAFT_219193 [Aspergillus oleicola]
MLLYSLFFLTYALGASATWVFSHDYDPFDYSLLERRQDVSIAGGRPGRGSGNHKPSTTKSSTKLIPTHTTTKESSSSPTPSPTGKSCAGNTPDDRQSWCDYDIDTNYHDIIPNTGVTREYWLEIDEITASPDGYPRPAMAINGTIPGPTLYADWGDWVVIHVRNLLHESLNGTSIHWHGIRQLNTCMNDGVVSITQCPITPENEYTYRWRAQQYGTSWYHSHIALQAWDGVAGGLIINGPATANYDVDAGTLFLNDWPHQTADQLFWPAQLTGPPMLNNSLINGTNVYGEGDDQTGGRFTMQVEADTSYRLRLINGALDTHYKFMIDNHTLTVIAMDLVPIEPYTTNFVDIAMGQRYDVIVNADKSALGDSFWLRSIPQQACSDIEFPDDIKGIFHYGSNAATPTTSPWPFHDGCPDEPYESLIPHVPRDVETPDYQNNALASTSRNDNGYFRWFLNSTTMEVFWENPTLLQISQNNTSFKESEAVIELPNANEWVYLIINTTMAISHPIHLHGHDFFVLAQGTNPWDGTIKTDNPPRRDTAVLPGNGYLVMAWETDNPGAWLMHCHIGWHTTEGFALQFVERIDEIHNTYDRDTLQHTCNLWSGYDEEYDIEQHDSGI